MVIEVFLASATFAEGEIGSFLTALGDMGFFSYLLPFLLLFALVFGILTRMNIFKETKYVNGIIALVVGLLALQFDFVSNFFSQIFPRMGVGLSIVLILLIVVGLFLDPKSNAIMYTLLGVGAVIVIVILVQTAGVLGWSSGDWWSDNWVYIAAAAFVLVVVGIIVAASNPRQPQPNESILAKALLGAGNS